MASEFGSSQENQLLRTEVSKLKTELMNMKTKQSDEMLSLWSTNSQMALNNRILIEENGQLRNENDKLKAKIQELEFQIKHNQLLQQVDTKSKLIESQKTSSSPQIVYPTPSIEDSPPKPIICTPKKEKLSETQPLPFTPLNISVGASPIGSVRKRKAWNISKTPSDKENLREQILANSPATAKEQEPEKRRKSLAVIQTPNNKLRRTSSIISREVSPTKRIKSTK